MAASSPYRSAEKRDETPTKYYDVGKITVKLYRDDVSKASQVLTGELRSYDVLAHPHAEDDERVRKIEIFSAEDAFTEWRKKIVADGMIEMKDHDPNDNKTEWHLLSMWNKFILMKEQNMVPESKARFCGKK